MKVNFRCTGCGKLLKASPDAGGRTRKCPVCATPVTCPEPVAKATFIEGEILDAEVVEAGVAAAPAWASAPAVSRGDAGAGAGRGAGSRGPFAVPTSTPQPASSVPAVDPFADVDSNPYSLAGPEQVVDPPGAKKPCPMCGEMILAEAAKCRFCGEVLDARLKKSKSKKTRGKSSSGGGSNGLNEVRSGVACLAAGIGLTVFSLTAHSGSSRGGYVYYGLIVVGIVQICRGFSR